jgi:hypothetical protein
VPGLGSGPLTECCFSPLRDQPAGRFRDPKPPGEFDLPWGGFTLRRLPLCSRANEASMLRTYVESSEIKSFVHFRRLRRSLWTTRTSLDTPQRSRVYTSSRSHGARPMDTNPSQSSGKPDWAGRPTSRPKRSTSREGTQTNPTASQPDQAASRTSAGQRDIVDLQSLKSPTPEEQRIIQAGVDLRRISETLARLANKPLIVGPHANPEAQP